MAYAGLFKAWATVLTAILVALPSLDAPSRPAQGRRSADCNGQVVLDPGHGGTDSGAVNRTRPHHRELTEYEKEQTLNVANRTESPPRERRLHGLHDAHHQLETLSNNDRYTYANTTGAESSSPST